MIRAKFEVTSIEKHSRGVTIIKMQARYDESIPEDQSFAEATPGGYLEMQVDNPAALEQLELGKSFYLDFTPIEE